MSNPDKCESDLIKLQAENERLKEALSEASRHVVPPGYVLVPEEPTEEMHNAARDWSYEKYGKPIGIDASDGCYRAMIAAAPAPGIEAPSEGGE